jgi:hypothetical protein
MQIKFLVNISVGADNSDFHALRIANSCAHFMRRMLRRIPVLIFYLECPVGPFLAVRGSASSRAASVPVPDNDGSTLGHGLPGHRGRDLGVDDRFLCRQGTDRISQPTSVYFGFLHRTYYCSALR